MPKLERLNIEPVRKTIREVFLSKIIYAKGLSKISKFTGNVIMPTLSGNESSGTLGRGTNRQEGLGEIMVVDIGGATTDIDSVAKGEPTQRSNPKDGRALCKANCRRGFRYEI